MSYLLDWQKDNRRLTNEQIAEEITRLFNDCQWWLNEYNRLKAGNPQTNIEKCAVDAAWSKWAAINSRLGNILVSSWYHKHIKISPVTE